MEWKEINGSDKYFVNNRGQVLSKNQKNGILTPKIKKGYEVVTIYVNGKPKEISVHKLVATYFIENKQGKNQINHIDGNKRNNNAENLEWCTPQENTIHAYKLGLASNKGEKNNNSKLKACQVLQIKMLINMSLKISDISKMYHVSRTTISNIKHGKRWKDLFLL